MDNSSNTALTKKGLLLISKSLAVLGFLAAMFNICIINTMPSDAELREKQDGSKQKFARQTTAKLQAIFHLYVAKNMEKKLKSKMKKATSPASFHD